MPKPGPGEVRLYTLRQANLALPEIKLALTKMRKIKKNIVSAQARVDIEEMTAPKGRRPSERIELMLKEIEKDVHRFHVETDLLQEKGCELKDLDKGLIDFYAVKDEEVVYLCWQEPEEEIAWWHSLEDGFAGRQPITDDDDWDI